jgi:hypothetical protein
VTPAVWIDRSFEGAIIHEVQYVLLTFEKQEKAKLLTGALWYAVIPAKLQARKPV